MLTIHSSLFFLHILFGSLALVLFWVPFFTKKGQLNHRKFGSFYTNAMYLVAASGAIMALIVLADPIGIKGADMGENVDKERAAFFYRMFWAFLLYLSLLSFVTTRHAMAVLKVKDKLQQFRTPMYLSPVILLIAAGPLFIYLGIKYDFTLHIIFGSVGLLAGIGTLKYCLQKSIKPRAWIIEHVSSMIGSGIGAYTAFVAFGGRTMLADFQQWQIVFWSAPGVIGVTASIILCKRYSRVFSVA